MSASVAWDVVGCFGLRASIPFLFFPLFISLSLALMRADPALTGIGSHIIYIYIEEDGIDHVIVSFPWKELMLELCRKKRKSGRRWMDHRRGYGE